MQHWLQDLKSDCLQSTTEETGLRPSHVTQTAEILHFKFPDITNHQISKKNNANSERCERISTFFSPVQRQTFISILKVIVLVLFQFGVESITPLKAEMCRTGSSSEPISMECTRTTTHTHTLAHMLHTHLPFVLTHPVFNYFRLDHCPAFFFWSPPSVHCLPSFLKSLPLLV